ncbi:hypothetical protein [Mycoplasma bradburyae]|uniref:hypothetical protein n=1 Tax=Mycoplasma bradburyae TaxID=2963128 RepID=UPI0023413A7E|nr:hypothetical protein [Mycoplasma bradburyae]MDC4183018.1 hypothetical protein [Mycoplasma bradburyae]
MSYLLNAEATIVTAMSVLAGIRISIDLSNTSSENVFINQYKTIRLDNLKNII